MNKEIAAIEFGTSKIVTIIAKKNGPDRLTFGSGTVPYDGYSNGDWNVPRQMVQRVYDSISAAELEAKSKVQEIYVGVPGEFIHVLTNDVEVDFGREVSIGEEQVERLMDEAAKRLRIVTYDYMVLHRTVAWYTIDGGEEMVSLPRNAYGQKLRALVSFVVADTPFIEDVSEMLGVLNITILGFLSPTLGLCTLYLSEEDRKRGAVVIDCGYMNTEISAVRGDGIIYHAILPRGGGHITVAISEELYIPMEMAESVKREYTFKPEEYDKKTPVEIVDSTGKSRSFSRDRVAQAVEDSVNELANMISLTLENDIAGIIDKRSNIYLTGGGIAMMPGGKDYLASRVRRALKLPNNRSDRLNGPDYTSALGLIDLTFAALENSGGHDGSGRITNVMGNIFKSRKAR